MPWRPPVANDPRTGMPLSLDSKEAAYAVYQGVPPSVRGSLEDAHVNILGCCAKGADRMAALRKLLEVASLVRRAYERRGGP